MNLIEKIITDMGSRWSPSGQLEAGIDGYVELFAPVTREATGLHLSVQSKAVTRFAGDSQTITLPCTRADIAYWLATSPRVILVVSQPSSEEAYWLSIRDFFGSPEHKDSTVAKFDRATQRLTAASYDSLLEIARPSDRSVARSPVAVRESILSNVVPLEGFPQTVYVAATPFGGYEEARARLKQGFDEYPPRSWALRENMLFSFTDPSHGLLARLIEPGTVEEHDARRWAESSVEEDRRLFVELLNNALIDDLGPMGIRFHFDDRVLAFKGTLDRVPRRFTYQCVHEQSSVVVVNRYVLRTKSGREHNFLRHAACGFRFRRIAGKWYVELTPTYRFTFDGTKKHWIHEDRLAGIKRLEGNRAVLNHTLLWNDALRGRLTLFDRRARLLKFGSCLGFTLDRGIPDSDWTPVSVTDDDPDDRQLGLWSAAEPTGS